MPAYERRYYRYVHCSLDSLAICLFDPLVTLVRSALKDFTFADGTFIPKGTTIGAAARGIHYDEAVYPNPHVFEPFRFVDVFAEDEGVTHQFISTTPEYLAFGHGRHAWYAFSCAVSSD